MSATKPLPVEAPKRVEIFSVALPFVKGTEELRLDASFYNPRVAEALAILRRSGLPLKPLREVTSRIFIPPRFKRIYVDKAHGVPFLQGSHVVHFEPADIKYLSIAAHTRLERWIIESGWILVTCSGTIGRVAIAPPSWNQWSASQHILRIVPDPNSACPSGYICAYLSSELGQAQLTSRIYGAVVDEITEEQARSVLVPVPETDKQKKTVADIDRAAKESVLAKDNAVKFAQQSVTGIGLLVPELKSEEASQEEDGVLAKPKDEERSGKDDDCLSLHRLDPKEALRALMQVDPNKFKERERAELPNKDRKR